MPDSLPLSEPRRQYHPFIDGLRAIAVLGVILFHCNSSYVTGGYVGVDIFFVLSGFLITGVIQGKMGRNVFSFAEFYERRCRRILPALFVTCALCTFTAIMLLVPRDFREFAKSLKGVAFFYSNAVFADSAGYFSGPATTKPLLHTWSLAVEEQFYLLFPPVLYALRWAGNGNRKAMTAVISILCGASFAFSLVLVQTDADDAFYLLPGRAWELLVGALIALDWARVRVPRIAAELLAAAGALGLGLSFACYGRNTEFPGVAAALPCASTALIIWMNMANVTLTGRCLSTRPLVAAGLISYGLYLYHWPVLAFARYFFDRDLNFAMTIVALGVILCMAILSYRWVELPIRSGAMMPRRNTVLTFSTAGLLVTGAVAILCVNADGFPARFSGAALQYASGAHDTWDWNRCMPPADRLNEETMCRIGAPDGHGAERAPATFVLWGDSHAAALEPAVDARARAFGISGWYVGYSRCPALIGAAPMRRGTDDHPCTLIADGVFEFVHREKIKNVVLVSRWDTYIAGWEPGGSETKQDLTISYSTPAGRFTGEQAFRLVLRETLRRFRAIGVDVWIIEQVPPQLVDVPSALAKAVYLGRDPALLQRPFKDIEERRRAATSAFENYIGSPGVGFVDPAQIFCPDETPCRIAANGHSLYSDGNHLSVFGALWSQAMLDPLFNSFKPVLPSAVN